MKIHGDPSACAGLGALLGRAAGATGQALELHAAARRTGGCWSGAGERAWQELASQQGATLDELGGQLHFTATALGTFAEKLQQAKFLAGRATFTASHVGLELSDDGRIPPLSQDIPITLEAQVHAAKQAQARHEALGWAAEARALEAEAHRGLVRALDGLRSQCFGPVPRALTQGDGLGLVDGAARAVPWVITAGPTAVSALAVGEKATVRVPGGLAAARVINVGTEAVPVLKVTPAVGVVATAIAIPLAIQDGESPARATTKGVGSLAAGGAGFSLVMAFGSGAGASTATVGGGAAAAATGPGLVVALVAVGVGALASYAVPALIDQVWPGPAGRPARPWKVGSATRVPAPAQFSPTGRRLSHTERASARPVVEPVDPATRPRYRDRPRPPRKPVRAVQGETVYTDDA